MMLVREKISQSTEILQELDIDVWLTFVRRTSENFDPALYFLLEDNQWLTWETAIIISKNGDRIGICGRFDAANLEEVGVYDKVVGYDESINEVLVQELKALDPQIIAINYSEDNAASDGLSHGLWLRLTKILEKTGFLDKLISAEKLIAKLRGRKTAAELERIRRAIEISEEGHNLIKKKAYLGMSELDIQKLLTENNRKHNVENAYPPLINVGPETKIGHGGPSKDIVLKPGYLINIDYGVLYKGYASDIQRLHYVLNKEEKEPPKEVLDAFQTVVNAITLASEKLKPGVKGWEVDDIARKYVIKQSYQEFKHALGHQIGRNVHDGGCLLGPKWDRYGKMPYLEVEEGNVFTLELHLFLPKYGFVSLEEDVLVETDGVEFLSHRQEELSLLQLT